MCTVVAGGRMGMTSGARNTPTRARRATYVGRSQEVGLRAQEREHQIDEDECPAQKTKASARLAKVENQAGNGQRDGDRIHQGELRSKEVEGTGADAAVVVPELKCGPVARRVPNEMRQQAQKRDA